jgi:hypothetical protein
MPIQLLGVQPHVAVEKLFFQQIAKTDLRQDDL